MKRHENTPPADGDELSAEHVEAAGISADLMQAGFIMTWREPSGKARSAFFTNPAPGSRWNFTYEPARDEWRIWDRTGETPSRGMHTDSFVSAVKEFTQTEESTK